MRKKEGARTGKDGQSILEGSARESGEGRLKQQMQPAVRLDPATGSAYVEIGRLRDRNAHPSKGGSEPLRRPQPASRNGKAEAQRLDFTLARRKIHVSFVEAAR